MNALNLVEHDALSEGLMRVEQLRMMIALIDSEQRKQGPAARRRVDLAVDMAGTLAEHFQQRMEQRRAELMRESAA